MVKQQVVAISASPKGETKGIAAFTRGFVKHGDNKVAGKKGLEAFDMDD